MDRKNKVWLIVLIALLILAVAGMVVSRNQLADKQAAYDAVNAQLTEAQDASAALQSDLDAAQAASAELQTSLEAAQAEVEALTDSLAAAEARVAELSAEPTEAPAKPTEAPADEQAEAIMESDASEEEKLAGMQALEAELAQTLSDLEAQRQAVTAAEAALADKQAELDAAGEAIAALEVQLAEMTAQTESDIAARAELEIQLSSAQDEQAAIAGELETARAEYEKRLRELEAYMLSRELIDGEAHVATSSASQITVAGDGVTAACSYANNSVSGNAVVLTIVSGGEELYRSEPIAPGESVTEVTLTEALAAGEHEATAVTTVYNEDGSVQLESRVPVILKVAE